MLIITKINIYKKKKKKETYLNKKSQINFNK